MTDNGNSKTTLEDLAKLAGVSISTVSRALNDQPLISTRTKQRIWALAREHDYPFRRSMPQAPIGAEGTIVIVTPHTRGRPLPLSHPFFLELFASIGEAARERGCDFTVSHVAPASLADLIATTTTSRANGVIFLGQSMLHEELNQLADTDARFVVWGAHIPGQKYRSIGSDNLLGGRRATLHLARLGRRRILFIGGSDPEAQQRRRGYQEALGESGIEVDPKLICQVEFELESADAAVTRLLRREGARERGSQDRGEAKFHCGFHIIVLRSGSLLERRNRRVHGFERGSKLRSADERFRPANCGTRVVGSYGARAGMSDTAAAGFATWRATPFRERSHARPATAPAARVRPAAPRTYAAR